MKFLIATTPQGVVSYISKGCGGQVSDKYLTENCGILNHLQPGDRALADYGFTVQDSVGLTALKLKCLPSQKEKHNCLDRKVIQRVSYLM